MFNIKKRKTSKVGKGLGRLIFYYFEKEKKFPVSSSLLQGFRAEFLITFSFQVPLIGLVIASAVLY